MAKPRKNPYQTKHLASERPDKHLCGLRDFGGSGYDKARFFALPQEHRCARCEAKAVKADFGTYGWLGI